MTDVRSVPVAELRQFITDPSELKKGTEIADHGGLTHLARHANKLFADAAGSGPAPYKTQIVFGDDKASGRCSCMAARSRPFCKHAAALLVLWARTPEAFVMADAPPTPADGGRKKGSVKRGKVDAVEVRKKGVEQAATVLSELWQTGVAALAADRAGQVAELASSLRELGLRRLSVRTLELARLLALAARRDDSFPVEEYAALVSDMWLTVRKLEKHLAGEALADEHVEELIGKTWTKKDRKPIAALDLVEYAFEQSVTADGFVLRESRFFDTRGGQHYSEKQILPAAIAKRMPPKPSYAGQVLEGARGSVFPSFAPQRVDLDGRDAASPLGAASLSAALDKALPSVSAALAALAERRRDVFAPGWIPALVRIDVVMPSRTRLRLLDREGGLLFVAGGRVVEGALLAALERTEALAVFGDVLLDGAVPCLSPLAILGRRGGALELVPLGGDDASALTSVAQASAWRAVAKEAGLSVAATLLGEVRDDLAGVFHEGTTALTARFVEPLAARLSELALAKQADALRAAATVADPTERLDALVKLHQVLGIALTRLVGSTKIAVASLVRIPTMPSVAIPAPAELLTPEAAIAREARGELHALERTYHVARHYLAMEPEALLADPRLWGSGDAAPFVIDAAASRDELAVRQARELLLEGSGDPRAAYRRSTSRLAKLTAIKVLERSSHATARQYLASLARSSFEEPLDARVRRAAKGPQLGEDDVRETLLALRAASSKEDRAAAAVTLAQHAVLEAIPALRTALRDRTATVRRAAAFALATLGDTQSLDTFVAWLDDADHERAKLGASALGQLGDSRGAGALLGALRRGFSPAVVREALTALGPFVLEPLLTLVASDPELVKRASVATLVRSFPLESTVGTLTSWIADAGTEPAALRARAVLAAEACGGRRDLLDALLAWIRENAANLVRAEDKANAPLLKKLIPKDKGKAALGA